MRAQPACRQPLGDAAEDLAPGRHVELAGGQVVEEKQRFGAVHHQVVDAHGDEVDADGVVAPGGVGDLELGADPIGTGDQNGVAVARRLEVEERPEAAERRGHAGALRRGGQRLDGVDQRRAGVDVDAGGLVIEACNAFLPGSTW